jgi:regulator of replication initiation timing
MSGEAEALAKALDKIAALRIELDSALRENARLRKERETVRQDALAEMAEELRSRGEYKAAMLS